MKKLFLLLMSICTIFFTGCNKGGDRYYSEEAVALAEVVEGRFAGEWTGKIELPKELHRILNRENFEGFEYSDGYIDLVYKLISQNNENLKVYISQQHESTNLIDISFSLSPATYSVTRVYDVWQNGIEYKGKDDFGEEDFYVDASCSPVAIDSKGKFHFDNVLTEEGDAGVVFGYGITSTSFELKNSSLKYNFSNGTISGEFQFTTVLSSGDKITGKVKFENLMRDNY
ncbi:MAG: hypothetical protein IKR71_01015 [Bacteroidales bacterium]|nr:hypothetical protein [Bacteroidales bacterium]